MTFLHYLAYPFRLAGWAACRAVAWVALLIRDHMTSIEWERRRPETERLVRFIQRQKQAEKAARGEG